MHTASQALAIEPSRKVRFDQSHRAIGQLHTRCAHLKMALVLKEVQMPPRLFFRVMHREDRAAFFQRKTPTPFEVDPYIQPLFIYIERCRFDEPRIFDAKRLFKDFW